MLRTRPATRKRLMVRWRFTSGVNDASKSMLGGQCDCSAKAPRWGGPFVSLTAIISGREKLTSYLVERSVQLTTWLLPSEADSIKLGAQALALPESALYPWLWTAPAGSGRPRCPGRRRGPGAGGRAEHPRFCWCLTTMRIIPFFSVRPSG